jgi:hypothetical protein
MRRPNEQWLLAAPLPEAPGLLRFRLHLYDRAAAEWRALSRPNSNRSVGQHN